MKTSNFVLIFFGFWIFYICNADWIDELYERLIDDYLGSDYEEVAPFVSSVTAGAEEFDQIIEELTKSRYKWYHNYLALWLGLGTSIFAIFLYHYVALLKGFGIIKAGQEIVKNFCCKYPNSDAKKEEIQNLVMEFLEKNLKGRCGNTYVDDIPVKLLWKGGTLVESSIHCNIRDESAESKVIHMQKHLLQSKLLVKCTDVGGGDEKLDACSGASEESTVFKMAEIRKLLESEPEIIGGYVDEERETLKYNDQNRETDGNGSFELNDQSLSSNENSSKKNKKSLLDVGFREESERAPNGRGIPADPSGNKRPSESEADKMKVAEHESKTNEDSLWENLPDQKLMNRIRLLESRLRLEELKNKNWINRISRAEGILHQLNKQVERIEETRPMETRLETLKITSTVTNWASSAHPRRNTQFTLVNQYQPCYLQAPCMSLSEVIEKEIGLPSGGVHCKPLYPLASTPPIPQLPSPSSLPPSSFLSKFLSR